MENGVRSAIEHYLKKASAGVKQLVCSVSGIGSGGFRIGGEISNSIDSVQEGKGTVVDSTGKSPESGRSGVVSGGEGNFYDGADELHDSTLGFSDPNGGGGQGGSEKASDFQPRVDKSSSDSHNQCGFRDSAPGDANSKRRRFNPAHRSTWGEGIGGISDAHEGRDYSSGGGTTFSSRYREGPTQSAVSCGGCGQSVHQINFCLCSEEYSLQQSILRYKEIIQGEAERSGKRRCGDEETTVQVTTCDGHNRHLGGDSGVPFQTGGDEWGNSQCNEFGYSTGYRDQSTSDSNSGKKSGTLFFRSVGAPERDDRREAGTEQVLNGGKRMVHCGHSSVSKRISQSGYFKQLRHAILPKERKLMTQVLEKAEELASMVEPKGKRRQFKGIILNDKQFLGILIQPAAAIMEEAPLTSQSGGMEA